MLLGLIHSFHVFLAIFVDVGVVDQQLLGSLLNESVHKGDVFLKITRRFLAVYFARVVQYALNKGPILSQMHVEQSNVCILFVMQAIGYVIKLLACGAAAKVVALQKNWALVDLCTR